MRIGLMVPGNIETVSGGYLYDRMLVDYLEDAGHHVHVISTPDGNYSRRLLDNWSPRLIQKVDDLQLDVLLQDELSHPSLFITNSRIKSRTKFPIIAIVHHLRCNESYSQLQHALYHFVESRYLQSVDGFIFNSVTTRESVEEMLDRKLPSVVAYPCGDRLLSDISEKEIVSRAKENGPLRIVFVGNVIQRKQLHILIEALKLLPANDFSLTVIGNTEMDIKYAQHIRQSVRDNPLTRNVKFSSGATDKELSICLRDSHIMAVPSSYEGFGIVYLEGMSFGLPAIGTTSGGAGEIIRHSENGFLVQVGDYVNLANHLKGLNTNRDLLAAMSLKALQHYRQHPTWQETCKKITEFLEEFQPQ